MGGGGGGGGAGQAGVDVGSERGMEGGHHGGKRRGRGGACESFLLSDSPGLSASDAKSSTLFLFLQRGGASTGGCIMGCHIAVARAAVSVWWQLMLLSEASVAGFTACCHTAGGGAC